MTNLREGTCLLRIVLGGLTALCVTLAVIAVYRTVDAARYAMSPEETTLYLIYAIPPRSVPRTAGMYIIRWEAKTQSEQLNPTLMTVRRNVGCRVELVSRTVDEGDPTVTKVERRIYDWGRVRADDITVEKVLVPGQGYEAYYMNVEVPGETMRHQAFRETRQGTETVTSGEFAGSLRFEWPYVPGQDSVYAQNREPFLALMQRCTGKTPKLPELREPLVPEGGIAT
ncbi:hypothetical protein [Aureimonas jatrophae]|uniref:Uncharacterized protein n=1 Tax=Aureimonas jatrophae TaxID=1166073 RepID=A0A1H0GZI5_9HYPH|nr:hypothetical protein [Aureimonas jatrophae]MBB3949891.1 hypothetical protein [Aureimonas jatrophae]SDO12283.1 hypothetical protein SAMN05192530_103438 [Aureimonas jatrophae]